MGASANSAWKAPAPAIVVGLALSVCFWQPIVSLGLASL